MFEINDALAILARKRPVFHSEADFQHAFAWEIQRKLPDASIRLELPVRVLDQFLHIDIWIVNHDETAAIELKYKTRLLFVDIGNEPYRLKNQSAQDLGRYDYIKDIQRLEQVAKGRSNFTGYAVLLTNDSAYWKPANTRTVDASFRISDGCVLEGVLNWGENASDGTKRNREDSLVLHNRHRIRWTDFSQPSLENYGLFRSLATRITSREKAN